MTTPQTIMTLVDTMDTSRTDIGTILAELFAQSGENLLVCGRTGRTWTRGEFEREALRFAAVLGHNLPERTSVQPRVALRCGNSPEMLIVLWAALLAGWHVFPIDVQKGREEAVGMLAAVHPDILVADASDPGVAVCTLELAELVRAAENVKPLDFQGYGALDYSQDYLTVFTSGSTGEAKGVVHSFGNLFRAASAFAAEFEFSGANTFFHDFPMSFMAGILNTFVMPLVSGSRIVVGDRQSVVAACSFWPQVVKWGADTFWFNPTFCSMLLKLDRSDIGECYCRGRKIVACIGTAPLDLAIKRRFEDRYGFELFESFGLSETLFVSTNTPRVPRMEGCVGVPLKGVDVSVADDGELLIDVPWLMKRYLRSEAACESPFRSGDFGELRDGGLFITGRKKDLVIKGGVNVSPRRIESFVSEHFPELGDVAVVGRPDALMGEKIVWFFTGAGHRCGITQKVNAGLRAELGRDFTVDSFVQLDALPLNTNGKIDKRVLREGVWR